MSRLARFITQEPWVALIAILALTLVAGSQVVGFQDGQPTFLIEVDPSTNRLLPEDSPERIYYEFIRKLFGSDETLVVALSDDDILTAENLRRVRRITDRLSKLPEVHHVLSLSNALNIRGEGDVLAIQPFVQDIPEDPEALRKIREEVHGNPLYAGNLVSLDGKTTSIVIYFRRLVLGQSEDDQTPFSDAYFIESGLDKVIEQIAEEESGDAEAWVTGGLHIKVAQVEYQNADIARAVPFIAVISALILGFAFRTIRGVVVPLLTVAISVIWLLGVVGVTGRPLNAVTYIIIPLFVILPLSYVVHVVSEYYDTLRENPSFDSATAAEHGLRLVALPVALTGLTTAAGFFALVLSPIGAIKEFGLLSVAGIVATVIASLVFPPALMSVLGRPKRMSAAAPTENDLFTRFATRVAAFNLDNRRAIFAAAAAVTVIGAVASLQIQVGAEGVRTYPQESSVRQHFDSINAALEGGNIFNVILESEEPGAFQEPVNLHTLDDLQTWLESQPEIGGTTSMVEFLKVVHRGFFENDPKRLSIPESRRLIVQLLLFSSGDELEAYVDNRSQITNIVVRSNVIDTELVSELVERIEARVADLPEHLEGKITGNPIVINRLYDEIIRGQARSVLGAFVLIYLILLVLFLDVTTAAKALVPNIVPVAFYFGLLGISGVPLSFATSVIAPMALGIAIDDTIHYFTRFKAEAKSLADERLATVRALRTVGRPVTFTTVVLCACFLVLTGSDLRTLVQFGALGAATLAFAWIVDFTLTPALCSGLRIVTLWDTLTLDLGDDPQHSIGIFRGMSAAQCRIVAQMATVREVPSGESITKVGDPGKDMFVMIDGQVEVWIDSAEGKNVINTCNRGDVIGEVGMFTEEARSTNCDVVQDARLLRLTKSNIERLRRRHPWTASALLRNLNSVQAGRLSKQTALMTG